MDNALDFQSVDLLVSQLKELACKAYRGGQAIDQTELDLHKQLMALGHALIGAIIERAAEGDVGPTIEKKGRVFKRMPKRTRRYRSIFGEFKIERYVYGTTPDQAIQAIPLDEHLGLPENDYSLVFELWIGTHATESSFHKAVELLERITTLHVPVDSAERIGNRLGKSAALVLDNPPSIDRATEAELLVQTSDNKGIPMVRKQVGPQPPVGAPEERMGPKPNQKQMACMAGVYTVDRNVRTAQEVIDALFREPTTGESTRAEVKAKNPRYFGALTKHDSAGNVIGKSAEEQAQQWLTANTLRRHRQGQEIVVMHDGQTSLWNVAQEYQEGWDTIEVLDLMHVLTRIWAAAKIIRPDSQRSYVQELLTLLLSGGEGLMIMGFKNAMRRKGTTKAQSEELGKIVKYLENNRSRIKYSEYLSKGLPICTGYIEGACRHVPKDRMEKSGMRWKEKGAQSMLNLRCIEASGLWDVLAQTHRKTNLLIYGKERENYSDQFLAMAS
jgi:hypothetical protein